MIVQDGQVVLVRFPEPDQSTGKLRPVLVVRRLPGRHNDWLVCLISSKLSEQVPGFDEMIRETDEDFASSGLKTTSLIRIARLATVEQRSFVGSIGRVSDQRLQTVKNRLSHWITESPRSM